MNTDRFKESDSVRIFSDYLARTHKRRTPERFAVLEAALSTGGHFSVEKLCGTVAGSGQHIATATVYNTVRLLVECGLLICHTFEGKTLYEVSSTFHTHTICTVCGKIRDIRIPVLEQTLQSLRLPRFAATVYSLSVYGTCASCARRRKNKSGISGKNSKT